MKNTPHCLILSNSDIGLSTVHTLLSKRGLTVTETEDELLVRWHEGPELRVSLERGSQVQLRAAKIEKNTPHALTLAGCDASLKISFDDLNEVLNETNTLIEIQLTLQDATKGWMWLSWNKNLVFPEELA